MAGRIPQGHRGVDVSKAMPMTDDRRAGIYGPVAKRTPKQNRRYSKKARVNAQRCPVSSCGAHGSQPCRTAAGNVAKRRHANRPV